MAEVNPPLYLPVDLAYGADELGLPHRDLVNEGVVGAADLAVTQRAAGANKSVDVAGGACWILGDDFSAAQPCYRCRSDAVVNKAIADNTSGNPRVDRVIARVYDSTFAGAVNQWAIEVLTGTPTAGVTKDAPGASLPALPSNAIDLAYVEVVNGMTSIPDAKIRDLRDRAYAGGGAALRGRPRANVYRSTNQTIAAGATVAMSFDTARYNQRRLWSAAAATRLTFPAAGDYRVGFNIEWLDTAFTTQRQAFVRLNGATAILYDTKAATAASGTRLSASVEYPMAAGDYVELMVLNGEPGSAQDVLPPAASVGQSFWASLIE